MVFLPSQQSISSKLFRWFALAALLLLAVIGFSQGRVFQGKLHKVGHHEGKVEKQQGKIQRRAVKHVGLEEDDDDDDDDDDDFEEEEEEEQGRHKRDEPEDEDEEDEDEEDEDEEEDREEDDD